MALNNTQYDTIVRAYNKRQLSNQHILEERQKEVYTKVPKIQELELTISSLSVSQAKKLLDGDASALRVLHGQISQLGAEKAALLERFGYPSNYLSTPYLCPDCQDTGYVNGKKCHCFRQAAIDLVFTQSNLQEILEQENFNRFSFEYYPKDDFNDATGLSSYETALQAVAECQQFVGDFKNSFNNLFLYGDTGVGKTFLTNCIAKELLDQCYSVIYFTAFNLFDVFRRNMYQKNNFSDTEYQNIFNCDLLIIDDLGTELSNSFTTSQLFLCLNERILRRKSTIISTNLNLNQIQELYSERTSSRISSNYSMIKLVGDDIRIKKKLQQM
ncbi:MAG: ATP-binding protein [Lachnospiraceae bacterium]